MAKRKFKVPRGTGAQVAKEQKLAPSHVTRVINGKREGGSTLVTRLKEIETDAADRASEDREFQRIQGRRR
jgi:hypothetical protein